MRKVLDMPDGPGISLLMERELGTKVSIQRRVPRPPAMSQGHGHMLAGCP